MTITAEWPRVSLLLVLLALPLRADQGPSRGQVILDGLNQTIGLLVGPKLGAVLSVPRRILAARWDPPAAHAVGTDEAGGLAFRSWPNGAVVVTVSCSGLAPSGVLIVRRFDATGNLMSTGDVPGGCNGLLAAVGDAEGNSLVLLPGGAGSVGGDAVLAIDGAWKWFIANGSTDVGSAPDWLASHAGYDFTIVRGERAYALLQRTAGDPHVMELYSIQGDRCGSLTFPVGGLTTGADGSVIGASGDNGCTKTVWPALLR